MNREQLKQRIVGAIVLVALGVIFIPMILNRDMPNSGISGSNIPAKPKPLAELSQQQMPAQPVVPAQPAETRTLVDKDTPPLPQASPGTAEPAASKPSATATPPQKPTESSSKASKPTVTRGWVVQLASFTKRKTALRLRDRVRKAGFTCYVEAVSGKQGTLYRVRVGPVIKHQEAERLQKKVSRQFRLKGTLIMSHP